MLIYANIEKFWFSILNIKRMVATLRVSTCTT
jgi:hypothetical protein